MFPQHEIFLRGEVVILTPQPPTWTRLSLGYHIRPVRNGRTYQQLRYRRQNFQDPLTSQAPPLFNNQDTIGGKFANTPRYFF